ncbi:uncharacterized protein LAESUDRAFT_732946, partial [Laetiporus sulphureus 93-53]
MGCAWESGGSVLRSHCKQLVFRQAPCLCTALVLCAAIVHARTGSRLLQDELPSRSRCPPSRFKLEHAKSSTQRRPRLTATVNVRGNRYEADGQSHDGVRMGEGCTCRKGGGSF